MSVKIKLTMTRGGGFESKSTLEMKSVGITTSEEFDKETAVITKSQVYEEIMKQLRSQGSYVISTEIEVKTEN
jgi:hypothetical protein